jgi:hypothetical protein
MGASSVLSEELFSGVNDSLNKLMKMEGSD